jgi:hypothetical protein
MLSTHHGVSVSTTILVDVSIVKSDYKESTNMVDLEDCLWWSLREDHDRALIDEDAMLVVLARASESETIQSQVCLTG